MFKVLIEKGQESYAAPACAVLPFYSDAAICETCLDGAIDPGTGTDWGEL